MSTELILDDIITDHRERMLNIRKYYPFFKLCEVSFDTFKDGRYGCLDMGYITMAVLRFFLEENNFKDKDVTYPEYIDFMTICLTRDFGLKLIKEEYKEVADFVFDKLKNEGRPFVFEYFDPEDRKKRSLRMHLITSRITDSTVWYSISADAIEFYLDTKEIKDESKISVEQLLLEKLIKSKNFTGGTDVVRRINSEVEKLKTQKNEVVVALANDVFTGMALYDRFVDTGMKWFADEQRLFEKNTQLIKSALIKAEEDMKGENAQTKLRNMNEIYELETQLKIAMNKHSELLRTCTDLKIMADEILGKTKLSRLRTRFNFKNTLNDVIKKDDARLLELLVNPLLGLNLRKTFNVCKVEELLSYPPSKEDPADVVKDTVQKEIIFADELEDERIRENYAVFMKLLLKLLNKKKHTDLAEYVETVKQSVGENVVYNADFYSFVVNLCQKSLYHLEFGEKRGDNETFLDDIVSGMDNISEYENMRFAVNLAKGQEETIELAQEFEVTNVSIELLSDSKEGKE